MTSLEFINQIKMMENSSNYPNCPHLMKEEKACLWLTNKLSRITHISPIFCNFECKKNGPYCGKVLDGDEDFIYQNWTINMNVKFAKSVLDKYKKGAHIEIPEEWAHIKKALNFLYKEKGFKAILLTGSLIVRGTRRPPKDYDVILWFDDVEKTIKEEIKYRNVLPKTINGIGVDYFFVISKEDPDAFFSCIDPERKIFYESRWFSLNNITISKNIKLVRKTPSKLSKLVENKIKEAESINVEANCHTCGGSNNLSISPNDIVYKDIEVGGFYYINLTAENGVSPVIFESISGEMPAGLKLASGTNNCACIYGVPKRGGLYNFTIKATDAKGESITKGYSLSILNPNITYVE
jgi:hypothetical protein